MSKWEYINFQNFKNYRTGFIEGYGYFYKISYSISIIDEEGKIYNSIYTNFDRNGNPGGDFIYKTEIKNINEIFSIDYYVDSLYEKRGYYRDSYEIYKKEGIKLKKPIFKLRLEFYSNGRYEFSKDIIIDCKEKLDEINFWATTDLENKYERVYYTNFKIGQSYLYGNRECKIIELYDYPNNQEFLCKIIYNDNTEKLVGKYSEIYYLPYKYEYKNKLAVLNTAIKEEFLNPILYKKDNIITIIWQPIEEAACYKVKLYYFKKSNEKEDLYFLKDYIIDRNEHILNIDNFILPYCIVVLIAEDREGNVIAQTRGFETYENKSPKTWEYKDIRSN